MELIESYGIGIQKIFESFSDSSHKPQIHPAPASFAIILPKFSAHAGIVSKEDQKQEISRLITAKGETSRKDIESSLSVPKHIAIRLLNELLEEKKIKKVDMAKAVRYFIR